jgi:tetratricopeptide (TPR) repeat protein
MNVGTTAQQETQLMITDRQGNPLPGATPAAAAAFDQAVEAFNLYRGDPIATVDRAIEAAPEFTMARILKAHMLALAAEPGATADAAAIVAQLKPSRLDDREASHLTALDPLVAGGWTQAAEHLDRHNAEFPRDLVALQAGHLIDFYRAHSRNLRDRIARVLPNWSEELPGYPVVLGMYAFGLEETGHYGRAEDVGRSALDREPLDCWAHHAVAHVMEMQGRVQDGIGWMIAREPHWAADDNAFKVHNWWHRALWHLDLGQFDEVLALYDGPIREQRSSVVLDLIDASALLWRLELCGRNVGDRWIELAAAWDQHADGRTYPFNDWHAVMSYLGAGRRDDVRRILDAFRRAPDAQAETSRWAVDVGVPLVEGFAAFHDGDYRTAAEQLHGVRYVINRFGGSHAQRDVIDWTLTEAAVRGRMRGLAEALANERLALKPHSPINRGLLTLARSAASAAPDTPLHCARSA